MRGWADVLEFWFPEGAGPHVELQSHHENWMWRMRGGADAAIVERFSEATEQAAGGAYDTWKGDPHGRLALIILLDQFSRSVWRNSPRAFSQDSKALALALEGYANGHYEALETPWYRTVYNLPLIHAEGPDHLARLDRVIALAQDILAGAPIHLRPVYEFCASQPVEVRKVVSAFGRHPHRNAVLGRASTPEEESYLAEGKLPHLRVPQIGV